MLREFLADGFSYTLKDAEAKATRGLLLKTGNPRFVGQGIGLVVPGQSSVRKGDAGSPSLLDRLQAGLSAHAYLTAMGSGTLALEITTAFPSMRAWAHTNR